MDRVGPKAGRIGCVGMVMGRAELGLAGLGVKDGSLGEDERMGLRVDQRGATIAGPDRVGEAARADPDLAACRRGAGRRSFAVVVRMAQACETAAPAKGIAVGVDEIGKTGHRTIGASCLVGAARPSDRR